MLRRKYLGMMLAIFMSGRALSPGFSTDCFAAEETMVALPEIIISSPVIEDNPISAGIASTQVSAEQIDDLNAQDMTSALRRTPGVTIARFDPIGSFGGAQGGGIFIRGMGVSRPGGEIATLIDGVNIANPIWGHPLLDIVPIDPASSIRVYKAAQPNLFGNAFAAVDIAPKRMEDDGFTTSLAGQYGSYNTFIQSFDHGGKHGRVDYYLGQSYKSSDGHRDHADGEMQSYYGRLGVRLADNWHLTWTGIYSDNFAHDPGKEGSPYNNGRYDTKEGVNILGLTHDFDAASGSIKFFQTSGEAKWDGESSFDGPLYLGDLYTKMEWDTWGARVREEISLWQGGKIAAGFDYDGLSGEQNTLRKFNGGRQIFDERDFSIYSAYTSISQFFGDKSSWHMEPSAGLRQYWHSEFDGETSPFAGISFGFADTEFHAGYSRGVLYPSLNVAILSEVVSPPLVMNNPSGWKDLSAEVMDHYEFGVSQIFSSKVKGDAVVYFNEGKDRYRMWSPNPSGMPPAGFTNIDSYRNYGAEASLTIYPTDDLSLFTGLAWLKSESPSDMPYSPEWTVSAGMNWRFLKSFKLSADALYRDKMYTDTWGRTAAAYRAGNQVDDILLLNAKVSWFFSTKALPGQEWEAFIALENITDADYEYSPGYPMPGITCMAGLKLNFSHGKR